LHYVRNHNGTPDIDPDKHELVIFGMVKQPLDVQRRFADALSR
jgi:sulfane dehydrogenase subunit SoxC